MSEQDPRFTKIDEAIQRLAAIAADISKMMAVHEQRITQQEKFIETMNGMIEKRRDVVDEKFEQVYKTIKTETERLKESMEAGREISKKEHEDQNKKIESLQKFIWMAVGGGSAAGFLINSALHFVK